MGQWSGISVVRYFAPCECEIHGLARGKVDAARTSVATKGALKVGHFLLAPEWIGTLRNIEGFPSEVLRNENVGHPAEQVTRHAAEIQMHDVRAAVFD